MSHFDHEKLKVYAKTIEFTAWVTGILQEFPRNLSVWDQLDRASTSMPLNIAEGTGKFTQRDKCRYYDSARGSALECAACLDVLVAKRLVKPDRIVAGKLLLGPVVSMFIGLIKAAAPDRVYEESPDYGAEGSSSS
jgi:four helix bundle protein